MTAALVRRKGKGVLALALSSSSPFINTSAFSMSTSKCIRRQSSLSITSPSLLILRNQSASARCTRESSDMVEGDYDWLKQSRPMRIHARAIPTPNDNTNAGGTEPISSGVSKIIHFQRHGQGVHNEIYDQWVQQTGSRPDLFDMNPKNNPLLLPNVLDAPLTDKGIAQCIEQRAAIARREGGVVLDNVELIISSPLVRCLQTAHYTFEDFLPCNSNASRGDVKWIVHDGIREELGTLLCNKRGPFSVTKELFPMVDYTHLSHHSENDEMWHTYVANNSNEDGMPRRETIEGMSHRGFDFFVNFLMKRPEKEIVVVGHSHFFLAMTKAVLSFDDSNDSFISPVYGQAEVRSMELVLTEQ